MRRSGLAADLVEPYAGRLARSLEISFVCMIVVIISMMFQIPEPALSTYLVFFAAKENSVANILTSIILIIVVSLVVAIALGLTLLSLNAPEGRIVLLAAVSFAAFFLATASKLAPLAGTMGLIVAYVLDLLGSSPLGEIATRGLLYALLFVSMPMLVLVAYSTLFGRHPPILLRQAIAARLRAVSSALRRKNEDDSEGLMRSLEGGNAELLKTLGMLELLRLQPSDTTARLRTLVTLSYSLTLTVSTFDTVAAADATDRDLPARVDALARAVEHMPRLVPFAPGREQETEQTISVGDLVAQSVSLVAAAEDVVTGRPLPEAGTDTAPKKEKKKEKSGFFAPDAFSNPDHVRFAGKGTAAVMICYLTFTLLDWPGIHTCMLTCFIVGLTTVGETMQKLSLRIVGCCVGAALGLLAIVYILPHITSITALVLVIGLVTLPPAWVAVGKPTVSYIGFQAAFALYLCILQGTEPKFDLTIARDRTIGILFGNIVVYVIFTRLFPVSMLGRLRRDLVSLIDQCRVVLKAVSNRRPTTVTVGQVADIQAKLENVEASAAAFGYEALRSRTGRLQTQASRLSLKALRGLVDNLGRIAAYPPPADITTEASEALQGMSLAIEAQLEELALTLSGQQGRGGGRERRSALKALAVNLRGAEPVWSSQIAGFEALQDRLDSLAAILSHYRRLLAAEAHAHA
jgi:multidrug resistance protein MdtO